MPGLRSPLRIAAAADPIEARRFDDPAAIPAADELTLKARRLAAKHGGDDARDILNEAINNLFPGRIGVVSSFGSESAVLLHLIAQVAPATPVIFLETGKHFAQTLSYRKKLASELGLTNVREIAPQTDETAEIDPAGDLWRRDTDACCALRKVRPLKGALDGFDAWITGRKQIQGGARLHLPVFEAAAPRIKVNPIVRWTKDDLDQYFLDHDLPAHPLVAEGFPSIGCWPCTHPAGPGEDARAGRWRGSEKSECGIHRI